MIEKVVIEKNKFFGEAPKVVEFKPGVNLVIGPVGSGKSSLLLSLMEAEYMNKEGFRTELKHKYRERQNNKRGISEIFVDTNHDPKKVSCWDFELDNTRGKGSFDYDNMFLQLGSMHRSNGEAKRLAFLQACGIKHDGSKDFPDVVILDEPDISGDIKTIEIIGNLPYTKFAASIPQMILSLHNGAAICGIMRDKNVNLIEMETGYLGRIRALYNNFINPLPEGV